MAEVVLLPYRRQPVELRPWDQESPRVAAALIEHSRGALAGAPIRHIGSTSVPGMAGKGVIDLAAHVEAARIPAAVDALVALGWQRQHEPWAHPPERPMLYATVLLDGTTYRSHLHLLPVGHPEWASTLAFRDALAADPAARARYLARKQEVVAAGITEGHLYADAKSDAVRAILDAAGRPEPEPPGAT